MWLLSGFGVVIAGGVAVADDIRFDGPRISS